MATAQQIADVRFQLNDTDSNHYAFTDDEIGDMYDEEGTVLRAAHTLLGIVEGSGEKLSNILQIDINSGYEYDVAGRVIARRLEKLEADILAEESGEYLYRTDDDRWTWDWENKITDMIA